jgi:hypothetical protein
VAPMRAMQRLLLGACALLLLAAALVSTPLAANAAVAAPTALSPNGDLQSDIPTLQWSRVANAQKYEVQVAASSAFTPALESKTTNNTRFTPTVQLPATTIHWRVRSVTSTGATSGWSEATFGRGELAGPTLQSPADGVTLPQPADPPVLSWSAVPNATSYEVLIDNDKDFIDATSATVGTTSYLMPEPQPATTFWWKVRAIGGTGLNTLWSEARSYTIGGLPEVLPTLPREQEMVEDVVFDWPAVEGAKDYELRVSTDEDFNNLVGGKTIIVKSTRYSPPITYPNDEYWWQVRARDAKGNTIAWDATDAEGAPRVPARHFQRHWPDVPVLEYPADSVVEPVTDPFFLQWQPIDHASEYQIDVGIDRNFSPGTFKTCYTRATTYTPGFRGPNNLQDTCGAPQPGQVYYWRVRAFDEPADVFRQWWSQWSEPRAFVYDPGVVRQVAPANGTSVAVPTLKWEASPDADRYHVEVFSSASATPVAQTDTYSLSWTPTPSKPFSTAGSPYRWTVVAIDKEGQKTMVQRPTGQSTFSISGTPEDTPAEPLTPAPVEGSSTRFPTLRWEPHPTAAYYQVLVGVEGTPGLQYLRTSAQSSTPVKFPYPAATDTLTDWLGAGTYDWEVEAFTASGSPLGASPVRGQFTIAPLGAVTGHEVALTGTALADNACDASLDALTGPTFCDDLRQTPVLDWDPVPQAGHYMVYLFRDKELTTPVYSAPYHVVTTQNTRWTPTELLPDSQAGDGYFWYIRPCKAPNVCAPEPSSATHAFDKRSHPIDVSDPRNVTAAADEIELYWQDNLHNNQEPGNGQVLETDGTISTNATVEAMQYRVEISDDPMFTNVLRRELVDQTTYTPYSLTFPEGPLYWRVQAVDGTGNSLTWSETRTIDKRSPAVAPLAPADGSVVEGTPYFRWAPQDFASGYTLEVYKDNDTTLSLTNRVLNVTTKQPAYTPDKALQASGLNYLWRVRRLDADNRPGQWSTIRAFKATGQPPTLVTPVASATVSGDRSYFSWEAVPGASMYQFERRKDGAGYSTETQRTYALSWAPTSLLTDGGWEWRVSSLDSVGRVIASSGWRGFGVDSEAPTVTQSPPTTTRAEGNWSVTFSEPVEGVDSTSMRLYKEGVSDPVSAQIIGSNEARTWTLDPSTLMSPNVHYTLQLRSSITDHAGNPIAPASYTGIYSRDETRPRVVRKVPGTRTRPTANWVVTFSEPVRHVSGTTMRLYRAGRARAESARITGSNGGRTWTLNPSRAMARRVRYTLRLSSGITDRAGNRLAATSYSSRVR